MSDIAAPDRVHLNGHALEWHTYPGYVEVICQWCDPEYTWGVTLAPTGELVPRTGPVGTRTESLVGVLRHCRVAVDGPVYDAVATLLALGATVRDAVAAYAETAAS